MGGLLACRVRTQARECVEPDELNGVRNTFLPLTTKEKQLAIHALRRVDKGEGQMRYTWSGLAARRAREKTVTESRHASLLPEPIEPPKKELQAGLAEIHEALMSTLYAFTLPPHLQSSLATLTSGGISPLRLPPPSSSPPLPTGELHLRVSSSEERLLDRMAEIESLVVRAMAEAKADGALRGSFKARRRQRMQAGTHEGEKNASASPGNEADVDERREPLGTSVEEPSLSSPFEA